MDPTMSTGTIPTDERANDAVGARREDSTDAPSLVAELVFRELVEAEAALAEAELRERTLLPGAEVHEALAELESRGLCTARRRTTDRGPRRYAATFPEQGA
jgi:hypothetical protein